MRLSRPKICWGLSLSAVPFATLLAPWNDSQAVVNESDSFAAEFPRWNCFYFGISSGWGNWYQELVAGTAVIRCRWFKRTAQHGKVEDSVWASFDPQISRSDQIRSETEEWRRQSRRVSTLWSSLCVRHSFGVFWVWCQGYQGLNWLNHVQSTQLFWKCSKLSYVV